MIELLDEIDSRKYNLDLDSSYIWIEDLMNSLEQEGITKNRLDALKTLSLLLPLEAFNKFWILLSEFACNYPLVYNIREEWMKDKVFQDKLRGSVV